MHTFRHRLLFSALIVVILVGVICQFQAEPLHAQLAQATTQPTQTPSNLAESYRLAAIAERLLPSSPDNTLAMLLSIQALKAAYTEEADMVLAKALKGPYLRRTFTPPPGMTYDTVAFSPDGRYVLTGPTVAGGGEDNSPNQAAGTPGQVFAKPVPRQSADQGTGSRMQRDDAFAIRMWDAETGAETQRFVGHTDSVIAVGFSPDMSRMVSISLDETLRLWDVRTGQEVRHIELLYPQSFFYLPDDPEIVVLAGEDVLVLDEQDLHEIRRFSLTKEGAIMIALSFSRDGNSLAALYSSYGQSDKGAGALEVWNVQTGALERSFKTSQEEIYSSSLSFSPTGEYLVVGYGSTTGGLLEVWDTQTGALVKSFKTLDGIIDVEATPGGYLVISYADERTIELWDPETGEVLQTLNDKGPARFTPDGDFLFTSACNLWSIWDGVIVRKVFCDYYDHPAMHFSPDGNLLLVGGFEATLWQIWDSPEFRQLECCAGLVPSLSPDGRYMAAASGEEIRVWDVQSGRVIHNFRPTVPAYLKQYDYHYYGTLLFSPDSRYVAAYWERRMEVWEVGSGKKVAAYSGVVDALFLTNNTLLLNDGNGTINVIAPGQQTPVEQFHVPFTRGEFSPDGQYMVAANDLNGTVIWNIHAGRPEGRIEARLKLRSDDSCSDAPQIANVRFSPDGRYLAYLSGRSNFYGERQVGNSLSLTVWDIARGVEVGHFPGVEGHGCFPGVYSHYDYEYPQFSPDGRYVLGRFADFEYDRFFDVQTAAQAFSTIHLDENPVASANWHYIAASTDLDQWGTFGARVWDIRTGTQARHLGLERSEYITTIVPIGFSPDDRYVYLAAGAFQSPYEISAWEVNYRDFVARVCRRLGRDLTAEERSAFNIKNDEPTCGTLPPLKPAPGSTWTPVPTMTAYPTGTLFPPLPASPQLTLTRTPTPTKTRTPRPTKTPTVTPSPTGT